jgi:hypothetical protein
MRNSDFVKLCPPSDVVCAILHALDCLDYIFAIPPRKLRILQGDAPEVVGVCESCNMRFRCSASDLMQAIEEINARFDMHRCERGDVSRGAATVPGKPRDTE